MNKVAILILSNTKNRNWNTMEETYLYNTIISLANTLCKNHHYKIYIGIDHDDELLISNEDNFSKTTLNNIHNSSVQFVHYTNIKKGHVTKMWNILYDMAYHDDYEYFYQMGDDINFLNQGWVTKSIENLKQNGDIGLTGPIILHSKTSFGNTLTQSFISRKHKEIFGYLFPEEIINWYCDDWINEVYKKYHSGKYYKVMTEYKSINNSGAGGTERYQIVNMRDKVNDIIDKSYQIFIQYLTKT